MTWHGENETCSTPSSTKNSAKVCVISNYLATRRLTSALELQLLLKGLVPDILDNDEPEQVAAPRRKSTRRTKKPATEQALPRTGEPESSMARSDGVASMPGSDKEVRPSRRKAKARAKKLTVDVDLPLLGASDADESMATSGGDISASGSLGDGLFPGSEADESMATSGGDMSVPASDGDDPNDLFPPSEPGSPMLISDGGQASDALVVDELSSPIIDYPTSEEEPHSNVSDFLEGTVFSSRLA